MLTPQNTAIDKPTTLNLSGYLGNTLTVRLTIAGSVAMPQTVSSIAKTSPEGRPLLARQQPTWSISGRVITIVYADTNIKYESWHEVAFDGRVVLSGTLIFNYATTPQPVLTDVTVRVDGTVNINVSVVAGGGGSGADSNQLVIESPISVSSGMLVGYVGSTLVRYDATTINHAHGLVGIATNAVAPGQVLKIQLSGLVTIPGWGLTPGQVYRAGQNGAIATTTPNGATFGQIVGRAKDSNTFHFSPQSIIKTNGNN